nr:hypothetical protein [Tanacetum cinerariifolium]
MDTPHTRTKHYPQYTIADMNIPANDVPTEPALAIAPPTRTDDQILPLRKWVPVGKSNYVLDVLKSQRNPIFKRIWEEFVQSIQSFFTDKKRLTMSSQRKKKTTPLLIPSIRFTKLIIHHLKTKHNIHPRTGLPLHYSYEDNVLGNLKSVGKDGREVFGMPIPDALLTDAIKRAPYYGGCLAHIAKYQRYLDGEHGMAEEEAVPESPAHKATKVTKPKGAMQTKPSAPKATKVTKPAGDKAPKPTYSQPPKPTLAPTKSSKEHKSKSPLKLVDEGVPVKKPVYNDEEANFQRAMELSLKEQEERTQGPAHPVVFREPDSGRFQPLPEVQGKGKEKVIDEQAAYSETESDVPDISVAKDTEMEVTHIETPVTTTGVHDEGQGGSDLGKVREVILKEPASSTGTLFSLHHLDKVVNFGDQFLNNKSSDVKKEKTHAEAEVESMVIVTIQPDTSSVPPMTFKERLRKVESHDLTGLIEKQMQSYLQISPNLDGRIDKRTSRLSALYNLNISHKVKVVVDEIVTDAVDMAMYIRSIRIFLVASTPPPSTDTNRGNQQQADFVATQETSPTDYLMNDDSILDEQVHFSDDEDTRNDHLPKADKRNDWWKPLPEEERPETPKPAWTIPSSNVSDVENNWATALVSTYVPPAKNSLLAKTGDMTTFMNWYCQKMEKCHKMLIDQINWVNLEGDQVRIDVSRPLPLGGPPEQMWIEEVYTYGISAAYGISHWWFNRQKFYIERHDSSSHRREVRKHMQILSVVRIKAFLRYGADFQEHKIAKKDFKNLYLSDFEDLNLLLLQVIRQRVEDLQLDIESYQTQLNLTKPGWDAKGFEFKHDYTIIESPRAVVFTINNNERKIIRFNKMYKFSDGTLTRIPKALDCRVKEHRVNRLNPDPRGSTQGHPLVSVEVCRYDKRRKNENKGIVQTDMELELEQSQQGSSHEVSVSTEGVEE